MIRMPAGFAVHGFMRRRRLAHPLRRKQLFRPSTNQRHEDADHAQQEPDPEPANAGQPTVHADERADRTSDDRLPERHADRKRDRTGVWIQSKGSIIK